jgi:crotonobetainyl-CoA:carnitine CoA-transferase CaiB-like acyl-CoA transferase
VQPLAGLLVADFSRYTPGPFASRELLRLGARVVRIEPPEGDPLRAFAPTQDEALNAGKESVLADLKTAEGLALAQGIVDRADIVLDGLRPGVLDRLGVRVPERAVVCAITGFGPGSQQAGHDVNYLGYAGVLADTAPVLPPVQIADLCAGSLAAVAEILAALLERERTGRGARLEVSMAHSSHRLVAHRLGLEERMLTGGLACYGIYATADGRWLTVGALEPKFFARLVELAGRPELAARQWDAEQDELAAELAAIFVQRPLAAWLELYEGEDVCAGPVATLKEAANDFGFEPAGRHAALGEHTEAWRAELRL